MRKHLFFSLFILLVFGTSTFADVPVRTEELIFSINAFNGMHFSQTFCRESGNSIYFLANTNNFMHLRKTLVYYWPLTGQWLTDLDRLDEPFDGILEIEQYGKLIKKLGPDVYLYYNEPGELENNWQVFIGADATAESERIETIETAYNKQVSDYREKYTMYENVKKAFIDRMQEYSTAGKDTSDLLARFKRLEEPVQPASPPYRELSAGKEFVLNLPEGEYTIRLRNDEGLSLEGSEKKLVVFDKRRENGIGYDVVPSDKWTIPVKSVTPTNVIYVDGTVDLYVIPFIQKEYNDLFYNKLLDNSSRGNASVFRWEKIQEVTSSKIEKTVGSESEVIFEKKYYVEPMQSGAILGYKILPYDPEGANKNKSPDFKGFHIPIDRAAQSVVIKLQNPNGAYYPLSDREIRIIVKSNGWVALALFILIPLVAMTIVLVRRNRVYDRMERAPDTES